MLSHYFRIIGALPFTYISCVNNYNFFVNNHPCKLKKEKNLT